MVRCNCEVCKKRNGVEETMNEPEGFEFEGFETEVDRVKKQHHDKQEAKRDRAKRERYNAQEAKRAPKIQADQVITLNAWLAGVLIAFVSSAVVSFNGITSVAVFVGLSASWMAALFFFFIELMYLLFLVAYLLLESRDDEDSRGALTGMIFFAAIAVLANAFHTLDYWQWAYLEPRMWAGIVLSVSAPIAIISASKMASRVIFAKALVQ